jgi:uncharacterized membrane protein YdcZ (DUF606 family)
VSPAASTRDRKNAAAAVLADWRAVAAAIPGAFSKLDPRRMIRSPVMFTVEVGAVLITALAVLRGLGQPGTESAAFIAAVVAGQLCCSLLLDHFGLMNLPRQELTAARLLGALLVFAGVLLVKQ